MKCGKPESSGGLCPNCWSSKYMIDGIRSVFYFEGTVREAIHQFKYYNLRVISGELASILSNYLDFNYIESDVIIPVPLHNKRLRQRGYNQSELIASKLAKLRNIAIQTDALIRIRDNMPQVKTNSAEKRRKNVENAFICQPQLVGGKKILLIDDVCTSGATLESCATSLKEAGASSVWGLTIAREI